MEQDCEQVKSLNAFERAHFGRVPLCLSFPHSVIRENVLLQPEASSESPPNKLFTEFDLSYNDSEHV